MTITFFHLYGLFIGIGVMAAAFVAEKAKKKLTGFDERYKAIDIDNLVLWISVPAVIGARLYHVIDWWNYYQTNFLTTLKIWEGGLGIYGGIIGGVFGIMFWSWYKYRPYWRQVTIRALDVIAIGLPIAQAVGRLGNYVNQEVFGLPTNLPWGIYIDPVKRPFNYKEYNLFHPLFLYEALLNIMLAIFLLFALKQLRKSGFYILSYAVGYGSIRFLLDFLRIDPWRIGILTTAQWSSVVIVILAFISYRWIQEKNG